MAKSVRNSQIQHGGMACTCPTGAVLAGQPTVLCADVTRYADASAEMGVWCQMRTLILMHTEMEGRLSFQTVAWEFDCQ
eukprot:1101362-Rhodomonas_salina.1